MCCRGGKIVVDLAELTAADEDETNANYEGEVQLEKGSLASRQTFFPLAVDDYFMAVAILSQRFSKVL